MIFDARSALLLSACLNLVVPLVAWAVIRKTEHRPIPLWYSGCFILGLAYVLFLMRGAIPDIFSIHLAQLALITSGCLLIAALQIDLEGESSWHWLIGVALAYLVVFELIFLFGSTRLRLIYFGLFFFGLYAWVIRATLRLGRRHASRGAFVCSLAFAFGLTAQMVRFAEVVWDSQEPTPISTSLGFTVLGMGLLLSAALLAFGYFGYILERVGAEKRLAERRGYVAETERDQALDREKTMQSLIAERDRILGLLAQSHRVQLLDSVSASVAHEINQPLAALRLNIDMLRSQLEDTPGGDQMVSVKEIAQAVTSDLERIDRIIRRTRALTRNREIELLAVDLGAVVESTVGLLQAKLDRHQIRLQIKRTSTPLKVLGDETLLQQVLLNVLGNAIEALQQVPSTRREIQIFEISGMPGKALDPPMLYLDDSGPGIEPGMEENLFELFHPDKQSQSGFGLVICRSIMSRVTGSISLGPSPLGGTRVTLVFRPAD